MDEKGSKKKTLSEGEISTERPSERELSRRSVLRSLVVGGAAATVLPGCHRRAVVYAPTPVVQAQGGYVQAQPQGTVYVQQPQPQVYVQQPQVVVQQPRYQTGVTDSDSGQYADPAGSGRGAARQVYTGMSDSDSGSRADAAGYGRGVYGRSSGLTDSDGGQYADQAGNGRGTARLGYTGVTDSDGGPYADQTGHGRGRW
jgi:hypothetical protein